VPEYLKLRFDEKTRGLNACSFAFMTVLSSGISLYALAALLQEIVHWPFVQCVLLSASIVLVYILLGGLTSAIYNEVLQFFMIVLGFAPLVYLGLKDVGGWGKMTEKLRIVAVAKHYPADSWSHAWIHIGKAGENPMGVEWIGLVLGLGFVSSFGYWCTDFLVVQRAMAANSMSAARRTPLIAAVPKMLFPALVILPGMIAMALHPGDNGMFLPKGADGSPNFNMVIPVLLQKYFPPGLLGIGFTALMASFMSGMAGNVTAFNTVWTYDIYQSYIAPGKPDKHYLVMGRIATVGGILISVVAAFAVQQSNNIMDVLQMVFAIVNAPLFATFLLGMFWKRCTGHGAFWGLLGGTVAALLFHVLAFTTGDTAGWVKGGNLRQAIEFPSDMGKNFYMALTAWTVCFILTILISLATKRTKTDEELSGLVYSLTPKRKSEGEPWYMQPVTLGVIILAVTVALNVIFR
jgi:SSS family solute:Na+ symporter